MDKNENIIKAMAECAGPDCSASCPYKDKGARNKSCRSVLLEDALAALVGEMAKNETLNAEVDEMKGSASAYRDERDKLREGWHGLCDERNKLREENKTLHADIDDLESVNNTIRAERDELRISVERLAEKCVVMEEGKKTLLQHIEVQKGEITALCAERNRLETLCQGKTDRRSVGFDGNTAYWCGRADALAEVVGHMFEGEAPCK